MWLTKNEKKVLKLLVDNAKLSDTSIANQLNISSQAIGKIRRKLEEEIIEKYTVELDLKKLGLNLFIVGKAEVGGECRKSRHEIEKILTGVPQTVEISKLTEGKNVYSFASLFKNIHDLKEFVGSDFKGKCSDCECINCIKILEISHIPIENILKHSPTTIFKRCIDDLGVKNEKFNF